MDAIVDVACGDQRARSGGRADARPTAFRFVAADERRALGISSHWPFESWGRFLPEHTTTVSLLHCHVVGTNGDSYRMKQARARGRTAIKPS